MPATTTELRDILSPANVTKAVTFGIALAIAQTFYKFGSFTLELAAFLPTWWVLYQAGAALFLRKR